MKHPLYILIMFFSYIFSVNAQNDEFTEFWLSFGKNYYISYTNVNLQIRIVSGNENAIGNIYFTNLGTSVPFDIPAQQVFTHSLTNIEKQACYNDFSSTTITSLSIRITSSTPVTVYALNQKPACSDATNVLPISALGNEYYLLSYLPYLYSQDAYLVVANQDNTEVFVDRIQVAVLNFGDVYYAVAPNETVDFTGTHITTSVPVSVFAACNAISVPVGYGGDIAFQQMAPVHTWGNRFFIPLATQPVMMQRVRAITCKSGTVLTVIGGILKTDGGGKNSLNLDAGEWCELEITSGCYIESNNPIAVCSYLNGYTTTTRSDCAQTWIPAINQMLNSAFIAPFIPSGTTLLDQHNALIVSPTLTRELTTVSIGGNTPIDLFGGNWEDGPGNMSYYNMPLSNANESYCFENKAKLFVLGYGTGNSEAYYYLAGSAMRDLQAAFYANNVHFQDLSSQVICTKDVNFRAEIEDYNSSQDSLRWYINDGTGEIEEIDARDQLEWSKSFSNGEYQIRMEVLIKNKEPINRISILKIQALWIKMRNIRY